MLHKLLVVLLTAENIIWLLPIIRQRTGRYSYFFGYLTISGLVELIVQFTHTTKYINLVAVFFLVLITSCLYIPQQQRKLRISFALLAAVLTILVLQFHSRQVEEVVAMIFCTIIAGLFLRRLIVETIVSYSFSIFTAVLLIYIMSMTIRLFFAITRTNIGTTYFVFSLALEALCGLFFIVFNENNPRLHWEIKSD